MIIIHIQEANSSQIVEVVCNDLRQGLRTYALHNVSVYQRVDFTIIKNDNAIIYSFIDEILTLKQIRKTANGYIYSAIWENN